MEGRRGGSKLRNWLRPCFMWSKKVKSKEKNKSNLKKKKKMRKLGDWKEEAEEGGGR